jgi:serine/threonine-protein kinase
VPANNAPVAATNPAPVPAATGTDASAQALANAAIDAHAQSATGADAPNASDAAAPRPIAGVPANSDNSDGASLQPLRRIAETRHEALLAKAPPPEPQVPVRVGPPKVAVVAIGDMAIAGPAQQVLQEALSENGFLLVDASMTPGLERMLHGGHPDLPAVLAALARAHGVRAVTVVRAEPLGETQLNYYGQSSTLFSANLTVKSYDADNHSPVNAGFMSKVDFTALNAQNQAREAIEPELRRYLASLSSYRPKGKGG